VDHLVTGPERCSRWAGSAVLDLSPVQSETPTVVGRYTIHDAIGAGGMATVHLGRLSGDASFARTVAVKRLHPRYAMDPRFVAMFLDEARLAARIKHPNVVAVLDVVTTASEVFLVMDYVVGESLWALIKSAVDRGAHVPVDVAVAVIRDVLLGLHAAHEAKSESGAPLSIVHRDVSPQNILVGADGQTRVIDFGIAKARGQSQTTADGQLKGKLRYMSPEQIQESPLTRATDVYAAGVVLWEILAGRRLFASETDGGVIACILDGKILPPSEVVAWGPEELTQREAVERLEPVLVKALARDPAERFATALEMALELEERVPAARMVDVARWVETTSEQSLRERVMLVARIEGYAAISPRESELAGGDDATYVGSSSAAEEPRQVVISRSWRGVVGMLAALVVLFGVPLSVARLRTSVPATLAAANEASPVASNSLASGPSAPSAPLVVPQQPSSPSPTPEPYDGRTRSPRARGTGGENGSARPARRADPCKPPFTWDSEGVKHYKPECM
jgi:serine/threonine protein kinase